MPLIKSKSKKAMSKNIATEMDAGKPQKQSVAIAYSVMRRARKNKKAFGGEITDPDQHSLQEHISDKPSDEEDRSKTLFDGEAERLDPLQEELDEDKDADDIVSRIMRKMRRK